jgi:hypothetical protein
MSPRLPAAGNKAAGILSSQTILKPGADPVHRRAVIDQASIRIFVDLTA